MVNWKGKTRGGTFGYLFFIFLIRKCGIGAAYAFLGGVVLYFIPFAPKATRSIWFYARNILHLGFFSSVRLLIRNYYRFGQVLIDKVAIGNGLKHRYKFLFGSNYQEFLDLLNGPAGILIISAHVGNWEIGASFFDQYGEKMNIVLFDAEYQRIKNIMKKYTFPVNYKLIPVNKGDLSHIFAIKEALDQKECICFQGDRFVPEGKNTLQPFMGEEARFPSGLFQLAEKMKAPVAFYFAMREPGRTYRFHFHIASDCTSPLLIKQYLEKLEHIVQQYPEQWFNYYDFWEQSKQS